MSQSASDSADKLPGAALRYLRALGHVLRPVVHIGKEGQTDGLIEATRLALLDHELIKVKILTEAPVDRHEVSAALAEATGAALAQLMGKTFLLYKRHPTKPRIQLPSKSAEKKAAKKAKARERAEANGEVMAEPREPGSQTPLQARGAGTGRGRGRSEGGPAPEGRQATAVKARGARRAYSATLKGKGTSRRTQRQRGRK